MDYATHLGVAIARITNVYSATTDGAAATARKPQVQTLGNEGSSPRADLGTAEVSVSQYRARIYEFERLIDRLYDLARADRFDELHDELRAEYRAIHGPRS